MTRTGWAVVASAVLLAVLGWWWEYVELGILAVGAAGAVVLALTFSTSGSGMAATQHLSARRVAVDHPASAVIRLENRSRARTASRLAVEPVGDTELSVRTPALESGQVHELGIELPTERRGILTVGPLELKRGDPLGLVDRTTRVGHGTPFVVYPRVHQVTGMGAGRVRDLDGPASDTSPHGNISFHALREYVPGDDLRHIHWRSSARTGQLMVRQYVDTRRPAQLVLMDTRRSSLDPGSFEHALEIVASLVVSGAEGGYPVLVATPDQVGSSAIFSGRDTCLDRLAAIEQTDAPGLGGLSAAINEGVRRATSLIMVTGVAASTDLVGILGAERRFDPRVGVRVGGEDVDPVSIPGARVLDVASGRDFATLWNSLVAQL